MIIFPAIDLLDGQVVRLKQGNYNQITVYNTDPVDQARKFAQQGAAWLHVIDLDGARDGQMTNFDVILKIKEAVDIPVQVGGGIRSQTDIERLLSAGIDRVIVSTLAIEQPDLMHQIIKRWGKDRIAVSLDIKDDQIMTRGWLTADKRQTVSALLLKLQSIGLKYLVVTDVRKDGMMSSPNFSAIAEMHKYGFKLIVAGGVSNSADVQQLKLMGVYGCIIGRAFYQ